MWGLRRFQLTSNVLVAVQTKQRRRNTWISAQSKAPTKRFQRLHRCQIQGTERSTRQQSYQETFFLPLLEWESLSLWLKRIPHQDLKFKSTNEKHDYILIWQKKVFFLKKKSYHLHLHFLPNFFRPVCDVVSIKSHSWAKSFLTAIAGNRKPGHMFRFNVVDYAAHRTLFSTHLAPGWL